MCLLCRLPVAKKNIILGNFDIWGDSCTDPFLPMRAKFGVLEHTQGVHLQAKILSEYVHCVGFRFPKKPQFLANFDIFGAPVPTPFYRWGPNLVSYSRPKVYTYRPNFIWMRSLCRLPVAKNHNFRQILTFLWAAVPTPFYRWGPNLVSYSRPTIYVYLWNFVSISLFCLPVGAKNPNFCRFLHFGI